MQKYRTSEHLDALVDGEAVGLSSDFDHEQPVYLASDVDARIAEAVNRASEMEQRYDQATLRIAELEKILRLCFFELYPTGTKYEEAYAESLKAANELMGTCSHD